MPSDKDARRVAAEADLDPRTVMRAFRGEAPRSRVTLRAIEDACKKLGIEWSPQKEERTE